ncbi:NAD(P)/FAD-dependent oxidoreductase [Saccharibacillus sp. CPCC 101409]|uniref:dihydrolipoyl dehydrogenase family protein n=1 Tax=Saccharibacillus sp. CPCC 101409 TaxID=3058041 RepID=UPI0026723829|nr:NAD(P)/FAD-dependent oxidoreductase [Saccharibacillus sp. CPCC 101409]MDO3412516.1 NAD(P)/FAD-dependent oxidoreductase [Saccharibacillus sp. CPCC 101409]
MTSNNTDLNFDLIVLGTGSAGQSVASACRKEGWSVAIVDPRPFGGTCSQRGCDPKRVLAGAAEIIARSRNLKGKGIKSENAIDWAELMAFKNTFTRGIPESTEEKFEKEDIRYFHGTASFAGRQSIQVGEHTLTGGKVLIATGAKPAPLSIQGEELLLRSDDFLDLEILPEKIVLIGGGYISYEFAHIAAEAGSEVHLVHNNDKPLKNFDPDLVEALTEALKETGVIFHLNTETKSIARTGNGYVLEVEENGRPLRIECGAAVHGAGRVPNIDELDLQKGGVDADKKGIKVDDHLRSLSNPDVYAAGDVSGSPGLPLTPIAGLEAKAVAANLLKEGSATPNYTATPSIVFTYPMLASVGMTEQQARESGKNIKVNFSDMSDWYTYKRSNDRPSMAKVILDASDGTILGAHVLNGEAEHLINYFTIAMRHGLKAEQLSDTLFAYPTEASDIQYLLEL